MCERNREIFLAFLSPGPELSTKKEKLGWRDVCKPKNEGGLGIQSIKEANKVCYIKLIWRIVTHQPTLWVNWIHRVYLHKESF